MLQTAFTELLGVDHPIVQAPMGGSAGGALAAAVSNGGGLGMIGGGRGDHDWLATELAIAADRTDKPWGIGFLTWAIDSAVIEWSLEQRPAALMLSFGDPTPFVEIVRDADIPLIVQVTNLDDARRALDLGADVVVAQGGEAGGHGGGRSTLPFVPAVVDIAGSVPVLAAGGIADGRGLAAALALGASGALIGTRFQATHEALIPAQVGKAIVDAHGSETERGRVFDIAGGAQWPAEFSSRTVCNAFLERWRGREVELAKDIATQQEYSRSVARGDTDEMAVWAGEAVDLITELHSAAELVPLIVAGAERAIANIRRT
ncbi:NAD(P)H-dependent flavin oxidoreductase [Antrihabitans cavernicola]|uniref:Nitronate monooxygenase n=1 Tax=Antrihabitans cavernicola TaxID=2495913 RepID=A0A5A7S7G5_9NOCA|nr:nitronate monooxygenase [Spelaeibacter cavernicola]KAA0021836.1 nitronate monooxygenase [Spelaeibacter cavernicola]